jgi:hypothetical protein
VILLEGRVMPITSYLDGLQLINALRAHQAELGLVAAKGRERLQQLVTAVTESSD